MPYIKEELRSASRWAPRDPGQLNFCISDLLDYYIRKRGLSYSTLNEVIGVLECAKLELYRRVASPYEDAKIEENGDVYSLALDGPPYVGDYDICDDPGCPCHDDPLIP